LAKLADERRRRAEAAERARLARLEVERQRRAEEERKAAEAREAKVAARRSPGDTFKDCDDCPEMVVIPPGTFRMGDLQGGGRNNEKPVHKVRIDYSFAVGKFEVTQAQWRAVMGNNPSHFAGDVLPVEKVSWDDAKAFIERLNAKTSQRYRLLSEAEWEYAARAGTETKYSWGNSFNSAKANRVISTKLVGSYAPNAFGLYDMHGNVWEWVEDCWHKNYQGAPADGSAWTGGKCSSRILRGGSWEDAAWYLRAADRYGIGTGRRDDDLGFRVARTLSQ
jgi:formylglycine-generating enzyme required for sulfatase activity